MNDDFEKLAKTGTRVLGFCLLIIMIVLFTIAFSSCGGLKKNKTETEKQATTKTDSTSSEVQTTKVTVITENDITTTEVEITPIDTTKSIEIVDPKGNVTKYKNAKISNRKTVDKTKAKKSEEFNQKKDVALNKEVKTIIIEKSKQVDRKAIPICWWCIIVFLIICYIIWRLWKNKGSIIKIFTGTWWL